MSKSITFHHGTTFSQEHNRRNPKYADKQKHIDKSRKDDNIIFVDRNIKEVYKELFAESVIEYNAKQKRSDRKINDYYQKIKNDKRKNVCYECIVQIGDKDNTGYSSPKEIQALTKFVNGWKERNPNLKLVGAYMHNDEGTSHLHIDYIPVSYDNTRGMKVQNSLAGALKQQGFGLKTRANYTEQMQWENSERQVLETICNNLGIDAKANQGLCKTEYFDKKTKTIKEGNRWHLSTFEYKKAREKMLSEITEEKNQLEREITKLNKDIMRKTESLNVPLMEIPELPEIIVVKGVFGKEKTRSLTEEERIAKQQEIDNIKKQNELIQQQALLREMEIIIREQEEKQKERFQKQNVELEELEKVKLTLQNEIVDLEYKKTEIIENADEIVKEKVDNALNNLDELQTYYAQSEDFIKHYRAYFEASSEIEKSKNSKIIEREDIEK